MHARTFLVVDGDGIELCSRAPDVQVHGRSTVKLLTCAVARQVLRDLDERLEISQEDAAWPNSSLQCGDVLSVADLLHASLLASDSRATACLARVSGERLRLYADESALHAFSRYSTAWASKNVGWRGHVVTDPGGFGESNRFTAREIVRLLLWVQKNDPLLFDWAGRLSHVLSVQGVREVQVPVLHTFGAAARDLVPEFMSGKTGTHGAGSGADAYIVLAGARLPAGLELEGVAAVMHSDVRNRDLDVRAVLDRASRDRPKTHRVSPSQ